MPVPLRGFVVGVLTLVAVCVYTSMAQSNNCENILHTLHHLNPELTDDALITSSLYDLSLACLPPASPSFDASTGATYEGKEDSDLPPPLSISDWIDLIQDLSRLIDSLPVARRQTLSDKLTHILTNKQLLSSLVGVSSFRKSNRKSPRNSSATNPSVVDVFDVIERHSRLLNGGSQSKGGCTNSCAIIRSLASQTLPVPIPNLVSSVSLLLQSKESSEREWTPHVRQLRQWSVFQCAAGVASFVNNNKDLAVLFLHHCFAYDDLLLVSSSFSVPYRMRDSLFYLSVLRQATNVGEFLDIPTIAQQNKIIAASLYAGFGRHIYESVPETTTSLKPQSLWILCMGRTAGGGAWGPSHAFEKGLSGSEEAVVRLSEQLSRSSFSHTSSWRVTVFSLPSAADFRTSSDTHVRWLPYFAMPVSVFPNNKVERFPSVFISHRGCEYLFEGMSPVRIFYAHDIRPECFPLASITAATVFDLPLPTNLTLWRRVLEFYNDVSIAVLSEFHLRSFVPRSLWTNAIIITNAAISSLPKTQIAREEPSPASLSPALPTVRCIYASDASRGLVDLLLAWPLLTSRVASFARLELHVYYGFSNATGQGNDSVFCRRGLNVTALSCRSTVQWLVNRNSRSPSPVIWHGMVGHRQLHNAMQAAHLLLYPGSFPESSCIIAMKALAVGLVSVTSRVAALVETLNEFDLGPVRRDIPLSNDEISTTPATWTLPNWANEPLTRVDTNPKNLMRWVNAAISAVRRHVSGDLSNLSQRMRVYAADVYSWETVAKQWNAFLSSRFLMNQARQSRQALDFRIAEDTYMAAISVLQSSNHSCSACWDAISDLKVLQNDAPGALQASENAVVSNPRDWKAWSQYGSVLQKTGQYSAAVVALLRAVALDIYSTGAWTNLGVAYQNLGKQSSAVSSFKFALAIHTSAFVETFVPAPTRSAIQGLHYNLAISLDELQLYDESMTMFCLAQEESAKDWEHQWTALLKSKIVKAKQKCSLNPRYIKGNYAVVDWATHSDAQVVSTEFSRGQDGPLLYGWDLPTTHVDDRNVVLSSLKLSRAEVTTDVSSVDSRFRKGFWFVENPTVSVIKLSNVSVIGHNGLIVSHCTGHVFINPAHGCYVPLSATLSQVTATELWTRRKSAKTVSKLVSILGHSATNFYHGLVEGLSRFEVLFSLVSSTSDTILAAPDTKFARFLLGLPCFHVATGQSLDDAGRVLWVTEHMVIEANELFAAHWTNADLSIWKTSRAATQFYPPRQVLRRLWNRFQRMNLPPSLDAMPDILYISRNDTENRRVTNEWELITHLHHLANANQKTFSVFGVGSARPPLFPDTIRLFRHAKVVIAPHGAALSHLLFCNKHVSVIEISLQDISRRFFGQLAAALDFDYWQLADAWYDVEGVESKFRADFKVDIPKLVDVVRQILSQVQER